MEQLRTLVVQAIQRNHVTRNNAFDGMKISLNVNNLYTQIILENPHLTVDQNLSLTVDKYLIIIIEHTFLAYSLLDFLSLFNSLKPVVRT